MGFHTCFVSPSSSVCAAEFLSRNNILTIKGAAGGNHTVLSLKDSCFTSWDRSAHKEDSAAARYLLRGLVGLCGSHLLSPIDLLPRKGTEHQRCCRIQGNPTQLEESVPLVYTVGSPGLHSHLTIADQLCLENKIIDLGRFHGTVHQTKITEHQAGSDILLE